MTQMFQEKKPFNLVLFVILGIVFWLAGLLFIRLWGDALFVSTNLWLMFLLAIPVAWVLVKTGAVIGKVSGAELLSAVVVMAVTALLLDGMGLAWFQSWYDLGQTELLLVAAWLLWGVGVSLTVGYWESDRYVE